MLVALSIVASVLAVSIPSLMVGFRLGEKRGASDERRAEALRRLKRQQETEWTFRVKHRTDNMDIYAHSPDGREYTRSYEDFHTDNPKDRKAYGYDDNWYEVDTATPASPPLQVEISRRYNAWRVLASTGARPDYPDNIS